MSTLDQEKAKAILGVVNHYLLHGDYPHLGKPDYVVVAQALRAFIEQPVPQPRRQAVSKTEYKRIKEQGGDIDPPKETP